MSNQNGKSIHMDSHLASASSLRDSKCHFWDILDWSHCDTKSFWSVASKVRHLLLFTCFSIWEFCKIKEWDVRLLNKNILWKTPRYLWNNLVTQCGNYGNLLSRIFGKNFVKVMVLLKKLLNTVKSLLVGALE